MTRTCSALKLHSPIRIMRPLEDIHINCEQDIEEFCSSSNTDIPDNLSSYLYGSSLEKNAENDGFIHSTYLPEMIAGYDETYSENEENENGNIRPEIARRLTDSESNVSSKSKRYSLSIGVRVGPKSQNGPAQGAKDNKRFLNYGPKTDTCLWDAFTTEQVSMQCASALSYFNDSVNDFTMKYGNESESIKQTSVEVPVVSILILLMCYILIKDLREEEDDNKGDETNDNNADSDRYPILTPSEQCEYQIIGGSKKTILIAVPLESA